MLIGLNLSRQGQSHEASGIPCQDSSDTRYLTSKAGAKWVVCAVADGVGSCSNSQYGSETAVSSALSYVTQYFNGNNPSDDQIMIMMEEAFQYAADCIIDKADEMQMPPLTFDTTLTVALFDGETMYFGHCGDGGIVVLYYDGQYEMITHRHKGEEASSVYPLRFKGEWEFGKSEKKVASAALMTDGVLDNAVSGQILNNRVYFPFFRPMMTAKITFDSSEEDKLDAERNEAMQSLLKFIENELMSSDYRSRVRDDLSFAMLMDTELVCNLPSIEFDQAKWDEDSENLKKQQMEALEKQAREQQEKYASKGKDAGIPQDDKPSESEPATVTAPPKNNDGGECEDMNKNPSEAIMNEGLGGDNRYSESIRKAKRGISLIAEAVVQIGTDIGKQAGERINKTIQKAKESRLEEEKAKGSEKRSNVTNGMNGVEKAKNGVSLNSRGNSDAEKEEKRERDIKKPKGSE